MASLIRLVRIALACMLLFAITCEDARADEWPQPQPVSFNGRGFQYVAEIFPPKSRQNTTDRPLCFFYEIPYGNPEPPMSARVVFKGPLVNREMPYEAVVSMDGRLVTFDDYGNLGFENAVVIYRADGTLVRSFTLDEILTPADLASVDRSKSSRYWRTKARYFFLQKPARLYVVLASRKAAELSLDDGKLRYQDADTFPELAPLLVKGGNEETEIWQTSLRFSSITDARPTAAPGSSAKECAPPPSGAAASPAVPPAGSSCAGCTIGAHGEGRGAIALAIAALWLLDRRRWPTRA